MRITIKKESLQERCTEVITNVKAYDEALKASDIIHAIIKSQTKRKYKVFGKIIKPTFDQIAELLKDEDLIKRTTARLECYDSNVSRWKTGQAWAEMAESMLNTLTFVDANEVVLTEQKEAELSLVTEDVPTLVEDAESCGNCENCECGEEA